MRSRTSLVVALDIHHDSCKDRDYMDHWLQRRYEENKNTPKLFSEFFQCNFQGKPRRLSANWPLAPECWNKWSQFCCFCSGYLAWIIILWKCTINIWIFHSLKGDSFWQPLLGSRIVNIQCTCSNRMSDALIKSPFLCMCVCVCVSSCFKFISMDIKISYLILLSATHRSDNT